MFSRKHCVSSPWMLDKPKQHYSSSNSKNKETHNLYFIISSHYKYTLLVLLTLSAWFLLLLLFRSSSSSSTDTDTDTTNNYPSHQQTQQQPKPNRHNVHEIHRTTKSSPATCQGGVSVYVYELPAEFNLGLLRDCTHLNVYSNMCPHVDNHGLGQPLSSSSFSASAAAAGSWFATHQFLAEMIFHARLENHPCRTLDPKRANLFYVPFYGGLHASSKFREANHTARDELAVQLVGYLQSQPWWRRSSGGDHFLALGRTAWDFMRSSEGGPDFGANSLLNLPPVKNMSVLTVERNPWQGAHQFGIPYPSYFHPYTSDEIARWQDEVRLSNRPHLFSFVGAPRKGVAKAEVRNELIRQCNESSRCELVDCGGGGGGGKCHSPSEVIGAMTRSEFCLQAPGDSFTRRSTFDSVLAGCIPVFFSPHTAYTQYAWYLPKDPSRYSVFIRGYEEGNRNRSDPEKPIEDVLSNIPRHKVEEMRRVVISLIPRLTYIHPNATDGGIQDAVGVALEALVLQHSKSKLGLPLSSAL